MRILLAGATGQIGYALAQALARTDHEVGVLVRRRDLAFDPRIEVRAAEVFDREVFASALQGCDHAIYGIGLPEQFVTDPDVFERINLGLLRIFLDAAVERSVGRLTYLSTYQVFAPVDGRIRESHPHADAGRLTPYFGAMLRAYELVQEVAATNGIELTTIHPAAVYGGRNTGDGFTNFLDNVSRRRFWRVPFVFDGRFPLVHTGSLADAVIASLEHAGPFLVSDGMVTLRLLAEAADRHGGAFVPPVLPVRAARAGAALMEPIARLTGVRPLMARVQIELITRGATPVTQRAREVLGWEPLPIDEGVRTWRRETATRP